MNCEVNYLRLELKFILFIYLFVIFFLYKMIQLNDKKDIDYKCICIFICCIGNIRQAIRPVVRYFHLLISYHIKNYDKK